jgi:hypothetical protein
MLSGFFSPCERKVTVKKLIVALLMASFVAFTSLSVGCNKAADSGSGKGGTTKHSARYSMKSAAKCEKAMRIAGHIEQITRTHLAAKSFIEAKFASVLFT